MPPPACAVAWHRSDLPPAVDSAQPDLLACHETEDQGQCRVFGRQRALRLHTAPESFVKPLDHPSLCEGPLCLEQNTPGQGSRRTIPDATHYRVADRERGR